MSDPTAIESSSRTDPNLDRDRRPRGERIVILDAFHRLCQLDGGEALQPPRIGYDLLDFGQVGAEAEMFPPAEGDLLHQPLTLGVEVHRPANLASLRLALAVPR